MSTETEHAGEGEVTRLDSEKRITRAEELLCTQYTSRQIINALVDEFGVVARTAYAYLKAAYERLHDDDSDAVARGLRKAKARATWQRQYQRCLSCNDMAAANYALDRLCKLDGHYAPTKHHHTVNATLSVQMDIRAVMGVLDTTGFKALDVLMQQIETAQAKGLLPASVKQQPDDSIVDAIDDRPKPIPVKRGKKPKSKA